MSSGRTYNSIVLVKQVQRSRTQLVRLAGGLVGHLALTLDHAAEISAFEKARPEFKPRLA